MSKRGLRSWDVALAALGAAALIVEGQLQAKGGLSPGAYALAVAAAAPLAWQTRAPLPALVGVEAGAVLSVVAFRASWAATGMLVVGLYTVALLGDRQRSLAVGGITAIGVVVAIVLIEGSVELTGIGVRLLLVFASLAVGDTIRSRGALRAAAREQAVREAREREDEGRRRAAEERLRIARELHDTLAHSLVAINVRASVAVDLHDSQDPSAALQDIKQASATALRDLRATLSLLREQDDDAPTAPAFDLDALPGLVDNARTAGLRADVDVDVDGVAVPSAIGGVVFRIVQEALTNVLRHADASNAHVRVRASADALDVEITDDGRANGQGADAGLGLRGMAERAAALGGRVNVGPREEGGWRVHAVLPLSGGDRR
ncbi:MAG: putative two-component system sensor kinase [Solirubrobacterales bacterium]|nr:putative two-component system sensor kinase [Solirubrobacterales bacterium]